MKNLNAYLSSAKYAIAVVFFALTTAASVDAQKFAYVDTEYILSKMPQYKAAQKEINDLTEKWNKEIDAMYEEVDRMWKEYHAEKVILTAEQRKEREEAIIKKDKEAKAYQQEKFGYEGELFKKRQELIKPIQDRVYEAIQAVAKSQNLDFIFDKSGEMVMLFSNSRYDVSAEVLERLGVTDIEEEKEKENQNLPPGGER